MLLTVFLKKTFPTTRTRPGCLLCSWIFFLAPLDTIETDPDVSLFRLVSRHPSARFCPCIIASRNSLLPLSAKRALTVLFVQVE